MAKCVGLALGGGVMRGLAHVGVLTVLEREGIHFDVIAGTSAGSLIGAMYGAGMSIAELQKLAIRIKWWHIARPVFPVRGLVTFAPMERYLTNMIGDLSFEDLKLPFAAVATDLGHGEPYVMRSGRLAPAVRASCSVPGLVVPVEMDGRVLCDGGVSNNLPVDVARTLGADYVIGVNLFDPLFGQPRQIFSLGFAAVETLVRRAGGGLSSCDCLISPDLIGASYVRVSKKVDLIQRGMLATERQLPTLHAALSAAAQSQVEQVQAEAASVAEQRFDS